MNSPAANETRTPTRIDAIAEDWVQKMADLMPEVAIWIGIPGRHDEFGDLSPAGHDEYISAAKTVLAKLDAEEPADDVDRVTKTDLSADLTLDIEKWDAGLHKRDLNVIASPAQSIRDMFDLMPHDSEADWATIASRMKNLPGAKAI